METELLYTLYAIFMLICFWFWGNTLYTLAGEDKLMWFWLCLIFPPLIILYWIVEFR